MVTDDLLDFCINDYGLYIDSLENNCGLCYLSGTVNFDHFPNKEEILEAILSAAEADGYSAVIFSFNPADRKERDQREAIQMLQQYPGASVCVAERAAGYSLFIITVPVVPVL